MGMMDLSWLPALTRVLGPKGSDAMKPIAVLATSDWPAFELADAMELGLSKELTSHYAEPSRGPRRGLTVSFTDADQHVLVHEDGSPLLIARPSAVEHCTDIFVACDGVVPVALGPAFRLSPTNEDMSCWELCSLQCECQKFQPHGLCRTAADTGRRVLFRVEQKHVSVGKGRIMGMNVELPVAGDVWCNCRGRSTTTAQAGEDVVVLPSKMPKWNKRRKSLQLSFGPRCKKSSIRNFQLSAGPSSANPEEVVCEYGKISNAARALDFQAPLGPVQAFALALTTVHWK